MQGSLYAPPELRSGDIICLPPEEAHHALRVLRLRPNEEVVVVDGEGGWYRTSLKGSCSPEMLPPELAEAYRARFPRDGIGPSPILALRIIEERRETGEPSWRLTLAQSPGKGRKFDLVVEKGTELGVTTFIPLATQRAIARARPSVLAARRKRWERIALAAMKQCGRSRLPGVEAPRGLSELLPRFGDFAVVLLASEEEKELRVGRALGEPPDAPRPPASPGTGGSGASPSVLALIGPEGGFTAEETGQALGKGAHAVTLGTRKLRTETAGIAMAALVAAALDS